MDASSSQPRPENGQDAPVVIKSEERTRALPPQSYSRNMRYKERFQNLRDQYEQVVARREESQRDWALAVAKERKMQAEIDLLLDALAPMFPDEHDPYYSTMPPTGYGYPTHAYPAAPPPPNAYAEPYPPQPDPYAHPHHSHRSHAQPEPYPPPGHAHASFLPSYPSPYTEHPPPAPYVNGHGRTNGHSTNGGAHGMAEGWRSPPPDARSEYSAPPPRRS
ncbi:hypothetical protein OF83DRAFT_388941 [Amylostereum chailletii]|nr:hypothetical protein OF83DRAFT_388941 [Amylostereum chailletii]